MHIPLLSTSLKTLFLSSPSGIDIGDKQSHPAPFKPSSTSYPPKLFKMSSVMADCCSCCDITERLGDITDQDPAQLQGAFDPNSGATSYIMPPPHLSYSINKPGIEQTSGFFKLPGELRNQIYGMCFEHTEYEVVYLEKKSLKDEGDDDDGENEVQYDKKGKPIKPLKEPKVKQLKTFTHWKYNNRAHGRFDARLFAQKEGGFTTREGVKKRDAWWARHFTKPALDPAYTQRRRREMQWPYRKYKAGKSTIDPVRCPVALLRVSKQIHHEAAQFFYGRISVSFQNDEMMNRWLKMLTNIASESLTTLAVHHDLPGKPLLTENDGWHRKAVKCWQDRVYQLQQKCPSLCYFPFTAPSVLTSFSRSSQS